MARLRWLDLAIAGAAPGVLTGLLEAVARPAPPRDYVFLYLALVSVLGVSRGLAPALVAAAASFLLVDYFFVPPVHTLNVTNDQDVLNLAVFLAAGGLVGGVGSRRRRAQLAAEAMAGQLRAANAQLERRNQEQAEAAAVALRLAHAQQPPSLHCPQLFRTSHDTRQMKWASK